MAPELFQKKKYDRSVDIWALGVLIYRMLFGNEPFKSMNMEAEIISKCENGF
jgi:serine/threonine protein kinase